MRWAARWRLRRMKAGIQFRILNSSKGPAVRATRAQADRLLYKQAIRHRLENQPNLWLFQQAVDDLMVEGDRVVGAVTQVGVRFRARAVVLTAGTFLDGKIHVGLNNYTGGRAGDPAAVSLSARLKELKLPQGRLKTGTPPRIDGRTIDYSKLEEQPGDLDPIPVFSFLGSRRAASAASAVLGNAYERPNARHHPLRARSVADVHRRDRRRWAALLPVDRGQDSSFCVEGCAPDLSRAGRADHERVLSERHFDQPAVRRATGTRALDASAWSTRISCGRATRSNTTTSIRAR